MSFHQVPVNPTRNFTMDGSGYTPWPEEPQEDDWSHDQKQRAPKIALIVVVAILIGFFCSIDRSGVSRLKDVGSLGGSCLGISSESRCDTN